MSEQRPLFVWRDGIKADDRLSHSTYTVLLKLSTYADMESGECWPGHANIADALRWTDRTVRTHIAKGIKLGWVEMKRRAHGGRDGHGRAAVYRLILPWLASPSPSGNTGSWLPQFPETPEPRRETPEAPRTNTGTQLPPNSQELLLRTPKRAAMKKTNKSEPRDDIAGFFDVIRQYHGLELPPNDRRLNAEIRTGMKRTGQSARAFAGSLRPREWRSIADIDNPVGYVISKMRQP